jgi:AcrR family transcriptional regulator
MSRPKISDKRIAILNAATRTIFVRGLGASTAGIAKEAGVATGSLFNYFKTKTDLLNELYLELKREIASAAMKDLPQSAELRIQLFHIWRNWTAWALTFPDKRRALAQLSVSDEIRPETRAAGHKIMAGVAELLERVCGKGPMRTVPTNFVAGILNSVAEATMDFMAQDPAGAKKHCKVGFEAFWRIIA